MSVLLHTNVVDAYRTDLFHASRDAFTARDQDWLILATLLERAIALPRSERDEYLTRAGKAVSWLTTSSADSPTPTAASPVLAAAYRAATLAEEHGAFAVATVILDLLRTLAPASDGDFQGRLLYQQARVLRKIGDIETAEEILASLQLGAEAPRNDSLLALAHIGLGAIARVRGNFPRARHHFGAAADLADCTDRSLHIGLHAHHGILVAAAVAQDFDTAIRHGALALNYADGGDQRAEILTNLASVLMDAGLADTALHGFLDAMAEAQHVRIHMAAVGGATICAARTGQRAITDRLIGHAEQLMLRNTRLVHEIAELCRELYVASAVLGDRARADHFKQRAEGYARQYGYFEILHHLNAAIEAPQAQPPLTDAALSVAAQLNSTDAEGLLLAATGTLHQG